MNDVDSLFYVAQLVLMTIVLVHLVRETKKLLEGHIARSHVITYVVRKDTVCFTIESSGMRVYNPAVFRRLLRDDLKAANIKLTQKGWHQLLRWSEELVHESPEISQSCLCQVENPETLRFEYVFSYRQEGGVLVRAPLETKDFNSSKRDYKYTPQYVKSALVEMFRSLFAGRGPWSAYTQAIWTGKNTAYGNLTKASLQYSALRTRGTVFFSIGLIVFALFVAQLEPVTTGQYVLILFAVAGCCLLIGQTRGENQLSVLADLIDDHWLYSRLSEAERLLYTEAHARSVSTRFIVIVATFVSALIGAVIVLPIGASAEVTCLLTITAVVFAAAGRGFLDQLEEFLESCESNDRLQFARSIGVADHNHRI